MPHMAPFKVLCKQQALCWLVYLALFYFLLAMVEMIVSYEQ